jgi:hypothetical protein
MPIVIRLAGSAGALTLATLLVWALDTIAPILSRARAESSLTTTAVTEYPASANQFVDSFSAKGRSLTHALRKLWAVERFDRIVAPASGFSAEDPAWILTNAPPETIVLRHAPVAEAA